MSYTEKMGVLWRKLRTVFNMAAPGLNAFQPAYKGGTMEAKLTQALRNYTGITMSWGGTSTWRWDDAAPAWGSMLTSFANDWWDRKTRASAKISKGKLIPILAEAVPALQAHAGAANQPDYAWNFMNLYSKHTTGYSIYNHDWDLGRVHMYAGAKIGSWVYGKVMPAGVKRTLNNAFPKGVNPF